MDKKSLDHLRNLIGKLNREPINMGTEVPFYQVAPMKVSVSGVQDPPPQITGVRNKITNNIPGGKAGSDKISGSMEAGGASPAA